MLIVFANSVNFDDLSYEDLQRLEPFDCANSVDSGTCWVEVLEGDISTHRALGEFWTWAEVLEQEYEGSDAIVVPEELRPDVELPLLQKKFVRVAPFSTGEDLYLVDCSDKDLEHRITEATENKDFKLLSVLAALDLERRGFKYSDVSDL